MRKKNPLQNTDPVYRDLTKISWWSSSLTTKAIKKYIIKKKKANLKVCQNEKNKTCLHESNTGSNFLSLHRTNRHRYLTTTKYF